MWRLGILLPFLVHSSVAVAEERVVKVFVLAGQSNMEGQGVVDLDHPQHYNGGKGTLIWSMENGKTKAKMKHLRDASGKWNVRDDVLVRYQTPHELKVGNLGIGFAVYPGKHHIGPELQIGHLLGDCFAEPVLLVKTCWGGKSLYKDFRPPSAGGKTGEFYLEMVEAVQNVMAHAGDEMPTLKGAKLELAGFFWFQGWNDMFDEQARSEYARNLVQLIDDFRETFGVPELPVVIGETGNMGAEAGQNMLAIRESQAKAAADIKPQGSAVCVSTTEFARPKELSPNVGHGHHWFGNAESYFLIGDAMGRAMIPLLPSSRAK
ncbi:MAG: sialate O-acetylesterase [Rubripirellula sp.]|jgi:hypothetical protein